VAVQGGEDALMRVVDVLAMVMFGMVRVVFGRGGAT